MPKNTNKHKDSNIINLKIYFIFNSFFILCRSKKQKINFIFVVLLQLLKKNHQND